MSGITGIYNINQQPVNPEQLGAMVERLAHRGADGSGIWVSQAVGLGHRLLWTTPESLLEKQPLVAATGDWVLAADARIDNRHELISQLDLRHLPPEKVTDSHLILAAYEKWGDGCPERLIGDFAFAIWDNRKQELFCARDYMGVRPFYYYYHPDRFFVFASEIKALLCLPQVPRQINEAKVGIFLCQLSGFSSLKTETFYQDIFRLQPAHWLKVSAKGLEFQSFWDLDGEATKIQSQLKSDEEYVEAFRERFTAAIACRLRSAYPIVSTLSGGLDSSSVSCVARNLLQKQDRAATLQTIYADCGVPSTDEKSYVNAVLAQGGFQHHIAKVTGAIRSALRVTPWLDAPVQMPTPAILLAMLQSVQDRGARVLLTGHDGDTIVSHGRDFPEEVESENWHQLQAVFLSSLTLGKRAADFSGQNLVSQNLMTSRSEPLYRKNKIRERLASRNWRDRNATIDRDFARRINLDRLVQEEMDYQLAYLPSEYLNHYRAITSDNLQDGSEQIDAMSAALGIEPRHPFLDKSVVELCLAVPGKIKYESGIGRGVMRRAMKNILPDAVRQRPDKVDFYGFIMQEVETDERTLIEELLFDRKVGLECYVEVQSLADEKQEFLKMENKLEVRRRKARILDLTGYLSIWLSESIK